MGIRYSATIGTMMGAALLVLWASLACGQVDHERIAEDVAREWAMTEADGITKDIAAMATRRYGGRVFFLIVEDETISPSNYSALDKLPPGERVPMSADVGQIQETIKWEFGAPTKMEGGRYEVIATASISFDIAPSESSELYLKMPRFTSELEESFSGSVDYRLEIDADAREVSSAKMPLYSVRIYRIPQERTLN